MGFFPRTILREGTKGHMLRRMLDAQARDEDKKPGRKTSVKEIWKEWRRTYWTGQSGRMIFNTIQVTPDDGKSQRRRSQ